MARGGLTALLPVLSLGLVLVTSGALSPGGAVPATQLAASASWKSVAPPSGAGSHGDLNGIACPGLSSCWAVGDGSNGSTLLIEAYRGGNWTTESSPNPTDPTTGAVLQAYLYGISCPSTTDCWAVGDYNDAGNIPLLEQYNGAGWTIVPGPSGGTPPFYQASLRGVSCVSSSDCWAVGFSNNLGTLVEQYNGSSWSIVPSPNAGQAREDQLEGISCPSAASCWAGGYQDYVGNSGSGKPLVLGYQGSGWTVVGAANPRPESGSFLNSVSCSSASSCWAAGDLGPRKYKGRSLDQEPLLEELQGGSWRTSQQTSKGGGYLYQVGCLSSSSCFAVGSNNAQQSLIERRAGGSWVPQALAGGGLTSIACQSEGGCWAVGVGAARANPPVLLLHYPG